MMLYTPCDGRSSDRNNQDNNTFNSIHDDQRCGKDLMIAVAAPSIHDDDRVDFSSSIHSGYL